MHIYAAKMHFSRCTHYTHVYVLMRTNKDILARTYIIIIIIIITIVL